MPDMTCKCVERGSSFNIFTCHIRHVNVLKEEVLDVSTICVYLNGDEQCIACFKNKPYALFRSSLAMEYQTNVYIP